MNFDILKEKFVNLEIISVENSFEKIRVNANDLVSVLNSLKNIPEYGFDMLNTIIAVDLKDNFELIYDLYSSEANQSTTVSVLINRDLAKIPSVVDVYKSAYFDECEIFDMFGVDFLNNPNLKRLFMPKGWIGHPLRKDYVFDDKRLAWGADD